MKSLSLVSFVHNTACYVNVDDTGVCVLAVIKGGGDQEWVCNYNVPPLPNTLLLGEHCVRVRI